MNWVWISTFKSSDFVNESTGRTFFIARRQGVTNSMAITSFPAACSLRNWKVFNFNLVTPSISANNHSFFNLISWFLKYPWQWNQRNLSVAGIPVTISRQNAMLCTSNPKWKIKKRSKIKFMFYEKASKIGVIFRDANIILVDKRTPTLFVRCNKMFLHSY